MDTNNNPQISKPHFLFVTFPAQGHINPSLELAKRLARTIPGSRVTFAAPVSAYNRQMLNTQNTPENLIFATYSDGYDEGFKRPAMCSTDTYHEETKKYMSKMRLKGKETLTKLIEDNHIKGSPFTCIIYTILLTWVATLAREFHVRSALLWVQPVTVFSIFYHYFNGYKNVISDLENTDPTGLIELPSLPPLRLGDLPSFLVPSSCYDFLLPSFQDQIESLKQETNPTVLVNSFQELEQEALNSVPDFKIVPIGPLITERIDSSVKDNREMYMKWLDTKPDSSVIYISFGTIAVLCKKQLMESAKALLSTQRPFLWVITDKSYRFGDQEETEEEMILRCFKEEIDEIGMVISWCDQFAVLNHKSIGCFVTHCGWNSTLESLVCGVPAVAFPQWTDQMTNAKLLEDVWKIGVRVKKEETVVESDEIRRCIEEVMETVAFRENAVGWRDLAVEAVREGGSSFNNLKGFVDEVM